MFFYETTTTTTQTNCDSSNKTKQNIRKQNKIGE